MHIVEWSSHILGRNVHCALLGSYTPADPFRSWRAGCAALVSVVGRRASGNGTVRLEMVSRAARPSAAARRGRACR